MIGSRSSTPWGSAGWANSVTSTVSLSGVLVSEALGQVTVFMLPAPFLFFFFSGIVAGWFLPLL